MFRRSFRSARITGLMAALVVVAVATLTWPVASFAAGNGDEDVPSTSIVPAEGPSGAASASAPSSMSTARGLPSEGSTALPAKPRSSAHHAASRALEVEPTQARLKVLQAAPVYSAPTRAGKKIEELTPEKFVEVTGATHYYLQVKLKSGQTGYIDPSSVELVKPTDKMFVLTHDAGVLEKPNRWSKKLAEVHQGHNVHVIGISLNYLQIRMKSGLQGFVPTTALE
jgi:hypothetical protein